MINLGHHQLTAINNLKSGSILCGGVGTGKSRTAIAYYFIKECGGQVNINGVGDFKEMSKPKDLYIITTAKKRDTLEWERECAPFMIVTKANTSINNVTLKIDSWNKIKDYVKVKNAFFIFDEQRLIGSGMWVKSFLKIIKSNNWIILSATPGDTWSDYIPVFVANGFYKNRTEFLRTHAVYNRFTKYPQIEKYIECGKLLRFRDQITVKMEYQRHTVSHHKTILTKYNKELFDDLVKRRWNFYKNKPVKTASELCYLMRKIVNNDESRIKVIKKLLNDNKKVIIFYNFNYELDALRKMCKDLKIKTHEWNGHLHQEVPTSSRWVYLVQYSAGAEGWNCIDTNVIIFYSQNYSYKVMVQAAGRIDRLNTSFKDLYYYHLRSNSKIDLAIANAIQKKKLFNTIRFIKDITPRVENTDYNRRE